jgi:Na+-transporting NADH:ubiquinone oxidoreductase subunit NqrA
MSDRACTQIKFNELLEDYRANILKEHLSESWDMMSDAEKSSVTKLSNFFCGLHVLVHAAETATSCLLEAERGLFESCAPHHSTSKLIHIHLILRLTESVKVINAGYSYYLLLIQMVLY